MSQFVNEKLHLEIDRYYEIYKEDKTLSEDERVVKSILSAYDSVENQFLAIAKEAYRLGFPNVSQVGSCSLTAIVKDNKVYAANAGDSKGVICSFDKSTGKVKTRKINQKFNANSKKE